MKTGPPGIAFLQNMRYNYNIPAAACQIRSHRGGNSEECMRKKANKERLPLLFAALLGALLLSNCGYRPEGGEAVQPLSDVPAAAAALPEETAAPQGKTYTVTYRVNGAETTELVAEGGSVQNAPEFMASENCAIVAWKNANGTKVDIRTAPVYADAVYEAVPGPALRREGAYIAAGNDGLFHPLDKFTRSDAARAVYALLDTKPTGETFLKDVTTHAKCYTAATTLVTAGYMTLNEGRFYPDVAITRADLAALLEKVFSPAAVERALAGMTDETPFTRAEAAAAINALLELDTAGLANAPYFPDVAPSMENYAAVELAGQSGTISWLTGDRAEPGFLNLDGYLYCVGDDGYFLRDTMVGTLYFDISGRYTSGDDALDTFVADIVDANTNASMTREEMLRAVYEYVRDHYLYLKRSLYEVGETGWEIPEALLMFQSGKGNCYNFTAAFWSLARGIGFDAVCYSGLVGVGRDPHSWVEITFDGVPYVFDVETEMSYRLVNDYITSMYWKTYEEVAAWSYVRTPEEAAATAPETAG